MQSSDVLSLWSILQRMHQKDRSDTAFEDYYRHRLGRTKKVFSNLGIPFESFKVGRTYEFPASVGDDIIALLEDKSLAMLKLSKGDVSGIENGDGLDQIVERMDRIIAAKFEAQELEVARISLQMATGRIVVPVAKAVASQMAALIEECVGLLPGTREMYRRIPRESISDSDRYVSTPPVLGEMTLILADSDKAMLLSLLGSMVSAACSEWRDIVYEAVDLRSEEETDYATDTAADDEDPVLMDSETLVSKARNAARDAWERRASRPAATHE